jgi:hypothetical protein
MVAIEPSIEDPRGAVAFAARKHEVSPAIVGSPPVAENVLPYRLQRFAAFGPARKLQHQMLCIRATGHFKPDNTEQPTSGAKFQLPLAAQFMNVKTCTLDVAALPLRIVATRTLTAHETDAGFDEI